MATPEQDPAFWSAAARSSSSSSSSSSASSSPAESAEDEAVRVELARKTLAEVQRETAFTWARRARRAYLNSAASMREGKSAEHVRWLLDAQEYEHEALEHAALADNFPRKGGELDVLPEVRKIIGSGKGA